MLTKTRFVTAVHFIRLSYFVFIALYVVVAHNTLIWYSNSTVPSLHDRNITIELVYDLVAYNNLQCRLMEGGYEEKNGV